MFATRKMEASNGDSWWAFFECDLDYSLAVSEVSPEDALEIARGFLTKHGWREEMGAEVGLLLCKQYERGRMEDVEAEKRRPIAINLNDSIFVKLEPWARDEVVSRWRETGLPERYCRIVEDADGVSKWTLWDFMHHFGKYMIMGRPESVKSMNVQIVRNT